MKKIYLSVISMLSLIVFFGFVQSSCKKENETITNKTDTVFKCPASILGLWVGTNAIDAQPELGKLYWSAIIKPDGGLLVETKWTGGEQHLSTGSWTLTGDTLSGSYTCVYGLPQHLGLTQTFKGAWDKTGKIAGIIKYVNATGAGTYSATKVN